MSSFGQDSSITAVIVSHNSAAHMAALADALATGSLAPTRLLLVDNASSDDTLAQAREAGMEVHSSPTNDGFGTACNIGLALTETEFLLICNPDVRPSPAAVEQLAGALSEMPGAAIAGVTERPGLARRFSTISGNVWGFLPARLQSHTRTIAPEVALGSGACCAVDYVIGAFMLCRVEALRSVGGFDERFFLYCEEEDLSRRLNQRGRQTVLVPAATVGHEDRTSSEGVARTVMASFYFHSLHLYYRKHRSRLYAELARLTLTGCVLLDRVYRRLTGKEQMYALATAWAPFRDIQRLRSELAPPAEVTNTTH